MVQPNASPVRKLEDYLDSCQHLSSHDEWWGRFSQLLPFVPEINAAKLLDSVKHRPDHTCLGNLVFSFRQVLHKGWAGANEPLHPWLCEASTQNPEAKVKAVATSGVAFHAYLPHFDEHGDVVRLETIDGLSLVSPLIDRERALRELGALMKRLLEA